MATIRKVMLLDPEVCATRCQHEKAVASRLQVKRVQPDAVALVARAAEMFVAATTQQAARHAGACKRKTVKLEDVRVVGNKDRRWADMGLGCVQDAGQLAQVLQFLNQGGAAGAGSGAGRAQEWWSGWWG